MRILKYTLTVSDEQTIEMPAGAKVLCVQVQYGATQLWALVDDSVHLERRTFLIYGTGNPADAACSQKYIGTFQLLDGGFVGHVFEA